MTSIRVESDAGHRIDNVEGLKELGAFLMESHAYIAQASASGKIEGHRGQAALQRRVWSIKVQLREL